jgi:tetratricopeptide (TPR) repeat protein
MSDGGLEARLADLQKRVERQPGSRFFVPLAEEYRKAGRLPEAIRSLEEGLTVHPGYVAARVALGRAYLEAGRIEDSMGAFSRALADDPANLVAAKALADLHMSRGEPAGALERYRLYRDISGDRRLDALIARLESETALPAEQVSPEAVALPPPAFAPPSPVAAAAAVAGRIELAEPEKAPRRLTDPFAITTSVPYRRPSGPVPVVEEHASVPPRDLSLDSLTSRPREEASASARREDDEEIVTRKIRLPEATWPFEPAPEPASEPIPAVPEAAPAEPTGRTLADLYYEQGHYVEAGRIYAELLEANPSDAALEKLSADARAKADAAAPATHDLPVGDPGRERRLAKIAVLNAWIDVVKTRGTPS